MKDKIQSLIDDLNPVEDVLLISLLRQKLQLGEDTGIELTRFKYLTPRAVETSYRWFKTIASNFLSETIFKKESDKIKKVYELTGRIGDCDNCKYAVELPSKYGGTYMGNNENNPVCISCHRRCCIIEDYHNELLEELHEKKKVTLENDDFKLMMNDFATLRLMMNNVIEKNRTIKN